MRTIHQGNYGEQAARFIAGNDGKAWLIAPVALKRWRHEYPQPRQWRAWMAYLAALGLDCALYRKRGYLTAPAEWPHEFDPERSIEADERAADYFRAAA